MYNDSWIYCLQKNTTNVKKQSKRKYNKHSEGWGNLEKGDAGLQTGSAARPDLGKFHFSNLGQAEIKIAGRNVNNLRYADDTNLRAESKEELNSLLMRVKEECEKGNQPWISIGRTDAEAPIIWAPDLKS